MYMRGDDRLGGHEVRASRDGQCLEFLGAKISTFRISCTSDNFNPRRDYGGVMVLRACPEMVSQKIRAGYIHIKDSSGGLAASREGQVHGAVTKDMCGLEPSSAQRKGAVLAGFAVRGGVLKINSRILNNVGDGTDGNMELSASEVEYIGRLVNKWKRGGAAQTVDFTEIVNEYTDSDGARVRQVFDDDEIEPVAGPGYRR